MPTTTRKTLAVLLIALHASIMLCGPGLHAAPGMGHFRSSGVPSKPDGLPSMALATTSSGEHCVLCDFFAQGQLPVERVVLVVNRLDDPAGPISLPFCLPRPLILSTRSRAPPALARIASPTNSATNPFLA